MVFQVVSISATATITIVKITTITAAIAVNKRNQLQSQARLQPSIEITRYYYYLKGRWNLKRTRCFTAIMIIIRTAAATVFATAAGDRGWRKKRGRKSQQRGH